MVICQSIFIQNPPTKHSSWWRRLQDAFGLRPQKTSSRRLGQDQYIRLAYTSSIRLQDIFKTSCQVVFKTFLRRLRDVFKTSSRRFAKTSSRHLQDVFKTFWRRLQDVFNTSCKDIFKIFSRCFIKLNCSCQQVFEKYCKDGYLQKDLPRSHFW